MFLNQTNDLKLFIVHYDLDLLLCYFPEDAHKYHSFLSKRPNEWIIICVCKYDYLFGGVLQLLFNHLLSISVHTPELQAMLQPEVSVLSLLNVCFLHV